MLTRYPGNREFLTVRFLMLIADGGDRFEVLRRPGGGYEAAEWYGGVRYESVLPEARYIQGLPAALASFESRMRRVSATLSRPVQRLASGGWSGEFDFAVGSRFVVRVSYRVRWRRWRLSELDVRLHDGAPLAEIAREELKLTCLC